MDNKIVFVTHNTGKIKSAERYFKNLKFTTNKGEYIEFGSGKKLAKWYSDALTKTKSAEERQKIRSKTFPGFAKAMAKQWGEVLKNENLS